MNPSDELVQCKNEESSRRKNWGISIIGIFVLLMIYVLSSGPVVALVQQRRVSRGALVIYKPLDALSESFRPLDRFLDWYITKLWMNQPKQMTSSRRSPANPPGQTTTESRNLRQ